MVASMLRRSALLNVNELHCSGNLRLVNCCACPPLVGLSGGHGEMSAVGDALYQMC